MIVLLGAKVLSDLGLAVMYCCWAVFFGIIALTILAAALMIVCFARHLLNKDKIK